MSATDAVAIGPATAIRQPLPETGRRTRQPRNFPGFARVRSMRPPTPIPRQMPRDARQLSGPLVLLAFTIGVSSCVRPASTATGEPAAISVVVPGAPLERAPARSAEEAEVMRTVIRFFDGMRAGDSSMVRSTLDSGARLMTAGVKNGVPALIAGSVDNFVRAVGTPHPEVWDERISGEIIHLDGPLAMVWMRYRFYTGTTFSHCGVNAFELFRRAEGWRITSIADTRRKEGCDQAGD